MKIGLLTFHDTTNFGSALQTFALCKRICDLGGDCEIVDYRCESIVKRELPKRFKFSFNLKKLLANIFLDNIMRRKYKELKDFLYLELKISKQYTRLNIKDACKKYDKFIVGSDIVWGTDITEGDLTYFLDFEDNRCKKFAFSSSIGNPWTSGEKRIIKPLLEDFKYIAVREDEAADWVYELTNNRPDVVCDPTMLLTTSEWEKYVYKRKDAYKYVLVYFDNANHDCLKTAIKYAKKKNLKVLYVKYGLSRQSYKAVWPTNIQDFLSLIYNAKLVITASYHGMLFSIYFNKQFSYFNRAHKSRMNTLAQRLGLEHVNGDVVDIFQQTIIDYKRVNDNVEQFREYSSNLLKRIV